MKSITAKEAITFNYDGQNKLELGSEPVVVSDEIARVAEARLGSQIEITDVGNDESHSGAGGGGGDAGPSHAELKAKAKELGLKQNGTKDELTQRIAEEEARLEEEKGLAEQGKKKATQDDLDARPELAEADVKVGDIIDILQPTE